MTEVKISKPTGDDIWLLDFFLFLVEKLLMSILPILRENLKTNEKQERPDLFVSNIKCKCKFFLCSILNKLLTKTLRNQAFPNQVDPSEQLRHSIRSGFIVRSFFGATFHN